VIMTRENVALNNISVYHNHLHTIDCAREVFLRIFFVIVSSDQTKGKPCDPGSFQKYLDQNYCDSCPSRTYADQSGLIKYIRCLYPLCNTNGRNIYSFCAENFCLNNTSIKATKLSIDTLEYCSACLLNNTDCLANSSISNLGVY
jgi:hypothetical protein